MGKERNETYSLDAPMELLLQVGDDFRVFERADLVLPKLITQSARQRNRSCDKLVRFGLIAATLAPSVVYGDRQQMTFSRRVGLTHVVRKDGVHADEVGVHAPLGRIRVEVTLRRH